MKKQIRKITGQECPAYPDRWGFLTPPHKRLLGLLSLGILTLSLIACSLFRPKIMVPEMDPGFCMNCHQQVTPGLFQSWVESKHAQKGVHCMTCHIDHQAASEQKSMVFPEKCGECHKKELAEFRKSRHSIGFERMRIQGEYLSIPQEIRAAFCERCHIIEKRCNSCHTSHKFSLKEARDPDACGSCHLGPDHPHKEMYETSLHGTIYKVTQDPDRAPRCVTCHMPKGTHNSSFGIARGPVGTGFEVVDLKEVPISKDEQERRREEMVSVCTGCHSKRFSREQLENADQVKEEGFKLQEKGKEPIREIEKGGLLYPAIGERLPHPTEGRTLVLADPQLYVGTSHIERLFFTMFKFHNIRVWKSGYHFSPAYTHGYGWAEMQLDLIDIKEEAEKLRELFKQMKKP
jgi:hydroxylamine dehydrogenase